MHLAGAKKQLEQTEEVTKERKIGEELMISVAIILRCAIIILSLGLPTFFYVSNRRIFSGSLFAVRKEEFYHQRKSTAP